MRHFYLLSLKVSGIKNIENPIEIKFYKDSIINNFRPDQYKIKAIYGENGAGKTAIISAMKILKDIISHKNFLSDTLTQKNIVENINKNKKSGFIQIEYYLSNTKKKVFDQYYLEFEVRDDNRFYIVSECLKTKNGNYSQNRFRTVFETRNGRLIDYGTPEMLQLFKERTQNLLEQRSILTFITDIEPEEIPKKGFSPLINAIFLCFFVMSLNIFIDEADDHRRYLYSKITNEMLEGIPEKPSIYYDEILKYKTYSDDKELVLKENFDEYKKNVARMCSFIQLFKSDLQDIVVETKERENAYQCNLIMKYENYSIDSEYESRGIRKLMDLFDVIDKACKGGISFIDELDASINDIYLCKLLEFFAYYGEGQICFTAHNLSPMKYLKRRKNAISFISQINTVHTWSSDGNRSPENAYRDGFIEDSPFNIDASDFLGILGESNE